MFERKAELFLSEMLTFSTQHKPKKKFDILKDKSDNKFLDLAFEANAHYLITGNTKDFSLDKHVNTLIVTPAQFLNLQ